MGRLRVRTANEQPEPKAFVAGEFYRTNPKPHTILLADRDVWLPLFPGTATEEQPLSNLDRSLLPDAAQQVRNLVVAENATPSLPGKLSGWPHALLQVLPEEANPEC